MWQDTRSTPKNQLPSFTQRTKKQRGKSETSPFTRVTNSRLLGVTLTKEVKDLFDKNFKSLKKEIEEDTRK